MIFWTWPFITLPFQAASEKQPSFFDSAVECEEQKSFDLQSEHFSGWIEAARKDDDGGRSFQFNCNKGDINMHESSSAV